MVVSTRDLPEARTRRWAVHGVLALLLLLGAWWAWGGLSHLHRLESDLQAARARLPEQEAAADAVAAECGLPRFSDEESLKSFPVDLPRFPTRRQMECANRVSVARADLIETYLEMERLGPLIEEARRASAPRLPVAAAVALALAAWVYLSEVRPRRRSSRNREGPSS